MLSYRPLDSGWIRFTCMFALQDSRLKLVSGCLARLKFTCVLVRLDAVQDRRMRIMFV